MNTLFLFIVALVCYGILLGIVIFCITLYKRTRDLNPLLSKKEELLSDLRIASSKLDELKSEINQMRDEVGYYQSIIDEGKSAKEYLEQFGGSVEDARNTISRIKDDIARANEELSKISDKINEENKELSDLRIQKQEAELGLKHAESERIHNEEITNRLEDEIKIKRDELLSVKADIGTFESKRREFEDLVNKITKAEAELSEKENDFNKLVSEIEQRKRELQRVKDEIEALFDEQVKIKNALEESKKEFNKVQDNINRLKPENEKLISDNNDLKTKIAEGKDSIEKNKEEKAIIDKQIEDAKTKLSELKNEIAQGEERYSHISTKIDNVVGGAETWGDLDNPVITDPKFSKPNRYISNKNIDEVRELDEFAAQLSSCNIEFNRRTINAFHTSLKVADSSPLVVLAGISGTGKSLLPQLYAKHFGFNFLNMAVQPRWDSSQDLFGFYNYAQYRYKATELSRLLWQYDVYNNTKGDNKCKFSESDVGLLPMNIVLLDEMNLARVEYYFSDMLSKLETRRTVDITNPAQRYIAEVEIECGSTATPRRLFVGSNTLFVGTMNEDETTQVLSDKIMDRANVLRFGRPKKLESKADPVRFESEFSSSEPRTFNQWKNMYNKKDLLQESTLEKVIDGINDAMEVAGRPFAHRVKTSIVNYINNYPGVKDGDERAFKNALSDQIEFKIMPKLNGLEKDSNQNSKALSELAHIIENIDDELSDTFDYVVNDSESAFFQWHGVRR